MKQKGGRDAAKNRNKVFYIIGTIGVLIGLTVLAVSLRSCLNPGGPAEGGVIDTERIGRAEDLVTDLGDRIGGIEESVSAGRGAVERGRDLIADSVPVIGEVGSGLDTITGGIREAQDRVSRIEEAGRRIEQTLAELREANRVLENSGDH
jgi:hypothetical protein